MRITTHKIGDTFTRVRLYNLGAGTWSAVAPVYGPGGSLLLNLAVTLTALGSPDADGNTHSLVVLATAAQTATWSETTLVSEVVFRDASPVQVVRSAEAYGIKTLHYADGTDSDDPAALIPGALLPALRGEPGPAGADASPADIAAIVNAAASKTTPVDADAFAGIDSEDGFSLIKFTWANIKATLKTYFDTLYAAASALTAHTGSTSNPHSVTAAQAGAIPTGGLKTVNGNGLEGSGDIAVSASIAPLVIADANTVEQRNGHAAQTYRLYNSDIDASNYERGFMRWNSNVFEIGTEAGGTGSKRRMRIPGAFNTLSLEIGELGDNSGFGAFSNNALMMWANNNQAVLVGYGGGYTGMRIPSSGYYGFSDTDSVTSGRVLGLMMDSAEVAAITSTTAGDYRDLKLRNLIATGRIDLPKYTTATRPAWVNGAQIFDSDLDKQLIGGVSAWEVVTSS